MKNQPQIQYRQGDVMIVRVDLFPKGLKKVPRENGLVILAKGDATGHAHFFAEKEAAKFVADDGAEFFQIGGTKLKGRFPILRTWRKQVYVNHRTLGVIAFRIAEVKVKENLALVDGEFGLWQHGTLTGAPLAQPDHNTQAVAAGSYTGGNTGNPGQSEFNPEETRRVLD